MHNQLLLDYPQSNEQYIDAINKVTKEDIIELVNQAQLDTIYVLTKGDDINEWTLLWTYWWACLWKRTRQWIAFIYHS